jgi:Peptidase family M28
MTEDDKRMTVRRWISLAAMPLVLTVALSAQGGAAKGGLTSIQPGPLKEWLSYIASDELQGREVYSEGLGLAASYIADHLKEWGVKPAGEDGTYFQTVKVVGVRTTSKSMVIAEVNGQTRTFKDGEGVTFPRNMGGRQTVPGENVEFVGYGLQVPAASLDDYADLDAKGKVVIWLGPSGPRGGAVAGRLLAARSRSAVEKGAVAVVSPPSGYTFGRGRGAQSAPAAPSSSGTSGTTPASGAPPSNAPAPSSATTTVTPETAAGPQGAPAQPAGRGAGGGRGQAAATDFTTVQRYDQPTAPLVAAQDDFFEFLFSGSELKYSELKSLVSKQEPLPRFALKGVKLTFVVEPDYAAVTTRLTRNVVGIIEGTDAKLKDSYVAFGAHYDHIGYQQTTPSGRGFGQNPGGCTGQTRVQPRAGDVVNNGADDDGSGTVALMAIARAFAAGPKPKRSLVFVWHTGEESGLWGSRYNADFPVVPNEKIVAQLNVDMIGRNRCDDPNEANSVYLVGSDRISTELHNLSEDANASMGKPLKLDYELNDPADPESIYTRSDHYSYASKGIPIIFYTTGLHRDYHYLTDEVDKIEFDKMAHVTQLIYTTGQRLANLDHAPLRDNKGPRVGKGKGGKIPQ